MSEPTPGQRIKALRERLGLSQIAFAGLLGVSNVTVNRWEHDRAAPQPALLARIERAGEVGVAALGEPAQAGRGNLRRQPPMLGREADIATARDLVEPGRLMTITGPGGVGKTRLAIELGRQLAGDFPDGVWFVDLAPVSDGGQIILAVTHLLGIRETGKRPLAERLAEELERRALLLIFDNCEHLRAACAELLQVLLASPLRSAILATSRMPLGVPGEQLMPLSPLALADASALFMQRAGVEAPGDQTQAEIALLCERLDRLPLAIELAAARSAILSVGQIARRLDRRFDLLRSHGGEHPHHRELETTIAWSYDLLDPREAALFRRLGIFAGWFILDAVEAVWDDGDALDLLDRLHRQSMIVSEQSPVEPEARYRLLESLALYARRQLDAAGETGATARRHAGYFAAMARDAARQLRGERHVAALGWFDREHDNVAAALDWLIRTNATDEALALANSLVPYWHRSSAFQEGSAWLRRVLDLAPAQYSVPRSHALAAFGMLSWPIGSTAEARRAFEQALEIARELGDQAAEADALDQLAHFLTRQSDLPGAGAAVAEALAIRLALGDPGGMARTLIRRGNILGLRSDFAASERDYHQAWELARQAGDLPVEAIAVANLGELAAHTGDYLRGLEFNRRSARIHDVLGDFDRVAITEGNSAELQLLLGQDAAAVELARLSVSRLRLSGNRAPLANMLYVQGVALAATGALREGLDAFREAIVIDDALANPTNIIHHVEAIARLHADGGSVLLAARLLGGADAGRSALRVVDYEPFDRAGTIARARAALRPDEFTRAWDAGCSLSIAGLVAEALSLGELEDGAPSHLYRRPEAARPDNGALTERQRDVLRLVAQGRSNREIARELSISDRTVERHLTTIFGLLGVDRRSAAVMEASARGLLEQRPPLTASGGC